ncbi:MAG: hypothetical protein ACT6RU_14610 [Aliihoeflea sp.]|uniref:hypothetical protein n=1 Tax=Aliihoeflea sp. TaxID=2608088 RepID=UPI0040338C32
MTRWCDNAIVSERALSTAAAVLGPLSDAAAALDELRRRRDLGRDAVCLLRGTHYRLEDRNPGNDAGAPCQVWKLAGLGRRLKEIRADCLADGAAALRRFAGSDFGDIDVGVRTRHGQLLLAYEAAPHVDLHYPRWTLQLCLSSGRLHQISCDTWSSPIAPGDLVLLDVHRLHGLHWAGKRARVRGKRPPYVALTWDMPERPSAADIACMIAPLFPAARDRLKLVVRQPAAGGPG